MTPQVEVKPLSRRQRRFVFALLILIFVFAVPFSLFYAMGYRFDFSDKLNSIKSVGGLYVRNDVANTQMFLNDAPVVGVRVFRKAAYIQNLNAGEHKVHVQGTDVQTWVKKLPVYPHLVTEVASFNLPKIPQIRLLTPWLQAVSGEAVLFDTTTATDFKFAVISNALHYSSTTATTTFTTNAEYKYIKTLFASSTEQKVVLTLKKKTATAKRPTFDVATSSGKIQTATTTKTRSDVSLFAQGQEVRVKWTGNADNIPYYYCLQYQGEKQTVEQYGAHVFEEIQAEFASSTDLKKKVDTRICRNTIRIDRLRQSVAWFDFYPHSTDLVLMLLDDGLYAVEIDDRSWQNTQLLYPGKNLDVVQDGGRIFVHDRGYYLEVFTSMPS